MRTLEEIRASGKVYGMMPVEVGSVGMLAGHIYDRDMKINFTLAFDEDGWEHVAISIGSGRRTPSWEVMCKAKKTFWRDDEDVIQLHPKEKSYFHGIEGLEVLHLWRPKDGDWSLMNK